MTAIVRNHGAIPARRTGTRRRGDAGTRRQGCCAFTLIEVLAAVSVIAPFQYSQMPFAMLAGFLLFDDWPEPAVMAGAAIVAASGVYVLQHEAARNATLRREDPTEPAQAPAAPAQASQ